MTVEELFELVADPIAKKIQNSMGLGIFAKKRAKFEGWLKVEVINILVNNGRNALPENGRVDVSFDAVGIELKTLNTSYNYPGVDRLSKPVTKNVDGVINDIEKLHKRKFAHKFVVFVVFPTTHDNKHWKSHFSRIREKLKSCVHREFKFGNQISGVIYFGHVA